MRTPCIVVIIGALLLSCLMLQNETRGAEKDVPTGNAPQKCSLAVLEFTFEQNYRGVPHEFETSLLRDKLITALVKTRKFNVVERARLDKVLDEQQFSDSGLVSKEHAVNLGKMLAADYLVMGSISVVKVESYIEKIPYVTRYNRIHEGIIIVDMRVVETEKGRIVAAEKGETNSRTKR